MASASCSAVTDARPSASCRSIAASGSRPSRALPNSSMLPSPIPAVNSRSGWSLGAAPAIVAAAAQRPSSSAAQASACGPPPDQP